MKDQPCVRKGEAGTAGGPCLPQYSTALATVLAAFGWLSRPRRASLSSSRSSLAAPIGSSRHARALRRRQFWSRPPTFGAWAVGDLCPGALDSTQLAAVPLSDNWVGRRAEVLLGVRTH